MKTAEPLEISAESPASIRRQANLARQSPAFERSLYLAIGCSTSEERAELLALYVLGRGGMRSYKVALESARNQPPERIAAMLAEKINFTQCLNLGLKRRRRHS